MRRDTLSCVLARAGVLTSSQMGQSSQDMTMEKNGELLTRQFRKSLRRSISVSCSLSLAAGFSPVLAETVKTVFFTQPGFHPAEAGC